MSDASNPAAMPTGSLRWLCQQYFASAIYLGLDDTTRRRRRSILDELCARTIELDNGRKLLVGSLPYKLMEPRNVARLRDEKAALPAAANDRVKALRRLFDWACDPEYNHARRNPAATVKYLPSNNPDGFKVWPEAEIAKYEKRHPVGTKARLALDLVLYTTVRRSDVVTLGPQMEQWFNDALPDGDGTVRVQKLVFVETKGRAKTKKTHYFPIVPELRASIDATPIGHLVYLTTEFGKPFSAKGFGAWFKKRCREAKVDPEPSLHGIRKRSAERVLEHGGTEAQLMALSGWQSPKQAAHYTRKVNRARLEASGAQFLRVRKDNKSVPLSGPAPSGGTLRAKKA